MTTPYCTAKEVVHLLGQAGVDLRQDDAPGSTGLYGETSLSGGYTQPAVAATVTVTVLNGLWSFVGQDVYVQGGGFYLVTALSVSSLTLQNMGTSGNVLPGNSIATGGAVSLSPLATFIERASEEIEEHCLQFYTDTYLQDSSWVRSQASVVAGYYYSLRRGNPAPVGIAAMYEMVSKKLEAVQSGRLRIPRLPLRKACVPRMSNMRPALRPHPHAVVERNRSTGTPQNYVQNGDPWDLTGINSPFLYSYIL